VYGGGGIGVGVGVGVGAVVGLGAGAGLGVGEGNGAGAGMGVGAGDGDGEAGEEPHAAQRPQAINTVTTYRIPSERLGKHVARAARSCSCAKSIPMDRSVAEAPLATVAASQRINDPTSDLPSQTS
jgi:hypothetical protein